MSCAAWRLKLSSTLVNGQSNKCKRATAINKNSSGSPKTFLFSAMTAERHLSLPVKTGSEPCNCFISIKKNIYIKITFINGVKTLFRGLMKCVTQREKQNYLPRELSNFPRVERPLGPARGGLWLAAHVIDRQRWQISASHNSTKRLTRKSKSASFFQHPACKYHFVALYIDNANSRLMISTARLDVSEPCSALVLVGSLLTSGWGVCPVMNWTAEMLSTAPQLRLLPLLLSCVTLVLLFQVTDAKRDLKSACVTCQQITDNFNKVRGHFWTPPLCCLAVYT